MNRGWKNKDFLYKNSLNIEDMSKAKLETGLFTISLPN